MVFLYFIGLRNGMTYPDSAVSFHVYITIVHSLKTLLSSFSADNFDEILIFHATLQFEMLRVRTNLQIDI